MENAASSQGTQPGIACGLSELPGFQVTAAAVPAARKSRQEHREHRRVADTAWCYSTVCWTVKISICNCCHQDACKALMGQQAMILRLIIIEENLIL